MVHTDLTITYCRIKNLVPHVRTKCGRVDKNLGEGFLKRERYQFHIQSTTKCLTRQVRTIKIELSASILTVDVKLHPRLQKGIFKDDYETQEMVIPVTRTKPGVYTK